MAREGQKRFPRTFEWFWRSKVQGGSTEEIASDAKVAPSRVRAEVSAVHIALAALVVAAGVVFVAMWHHGKGPSGNDHVANSGSTNAPPPPPPPATSRPSQHDLWLAQAAQLRAGAKTKCDQGLWTGCYDDLRKAADLDPDGNTPEWQAPGEVHHERQRQRQPQVHHPRDRVPEERAPRRGARPRHATARRSVRSRRRRAARLPRDAADERRGSRQWPRGFGHRLDLQRASAGPAGSSRCRFSTATSSRPATISLRSRRGVSS